MRTLELVDLRLNHERAHDGQFCELIAHQAIRRDLVQIGVAISALCDFHFNHELWQSALKRAGITGLRFHDLRHTAATRMAECGVDAFTIAAILGHKSVEMTARYAHAPGA